MKFHWRHLFKKKQHHGYDAHKTRLGKIWHFLAHEESMASFIVDAILIILIGKYLLFPGLSMALGTPYPVVAVVSGSMDHHGQGFDAWWTQNGAWYEQHNITKVQFETFYRSNGFAKGDVFVVRGINSDIKVGDILVYRVSERSEPIIHRVVAINPDGTLQTKGDANQAQLSFEESVSESQVAGRAVAWAPLIGWVKVGLLELMGRA
jgi:signal peptidase I